METQATIDAKALKLAVTENWTRNVKARANTCAYCGHPHGQVPCQAIKREAGFADWVCQCPKHWVGFPQTR